MISFDWMLIGFGGFILLLCLLCLCRMWRIRRSNLMQTGIRTVRYGRGRRCLNDSCAICLQEFRRRDRIDVGCCNHGFHKKCFAEWLSQNTTCPICKTDVRNPAVKVYTVG